MTGYVVAGVTGHVGSVVAAELLERGQRIRVVVRDPLRAIGWSGRGADVAAGSLDDRAFLAGALRGVRGFFTLLPGHPMDPEYPDAMLPLADAIAEAVKASGVPHVVALSSLGAELPSGNGPIRTLHHFENVLRATGAAVTAVRACYFQENLGAMIPPARNAGIYPNPMPSADFAFPMVATRDVGRVAAELLLSPPATSEVVDVLGPGYSARDIAERLSALLGKDVRVVDIPAAAQVSAFLEAGFPERAAETFAELNAAIGSEILVPRGDRMVNGTTPIDETLRAMVAAG